MNRRTFLTISTFSLINLHAIDFRESKKEAWKARNINNTMIKLYGKEAFSSIKKSENIELIATKHLVENAYSIPITIIQTANEQSLIAVFSVPQNEIIHYTTNIRMERKGTLFIVVEALNG